MPSLTRQVQNELSKFLAEGSIAIDATAGNGHDTAFLAEQTGDCGHVYAFDIQHQAIENTRNRLQELKLEQHVTLIKDSHEYLQTHIPANYQGQISVVMFNLGYLPGSDKHCVTSTESTLKALNQAISQLKPGGALSIMLYPGHEGGQEETNAVLNWGRNLLSPWKTRHIFTAGPQWLLVTCSESVFS
ncbi:MAG: methyltransferase domain-containing protein [Gammaproteobacteria bacterium]|nr:methyltransferase domain-containing protein [Gammaproteobacteria bacterium]